MYTSPEPCFPGGIPSVFIPEVGDIHNLQQRRDLEKTPRTAGWPTVEGGCMQLMFDDLYVFIVTTTFETNCQKSIETSANMKTNFRVEKDC